MEGGSRLGSAPEMGWVLGMDSLLDIAGGVFRCFFFLWIVLVGQLLMGYTDWKKMISDEGAGMLGKDRGLFGG